MCLIVKTGEKIQITDKDIKVYKIGEMERIREVSYLVSPFMGFKYEFDKKYSLGRPLEIVFENEMQAIKEGFHTYISQAFIPYPCKSVCDAIIPKGAEYCFGHGGDVVSNELIVLNPIKIELL